MASTNTPAQIKAKYVRLMGSQAGEAFAELMQDAARLHLKWNEFLALFAVSPAQIDTLNKAAPGFFYLVSETWWDGLILHIFRMTDGNRKVLSLVTFGDRHARRRGPPLASHNSMTDRDQHGRWGSGNNVGGKSLLRRSRSTERRLRRSKWARSSA